MIILNLLEKATVIAMKRVIVWQIKKEMLSQNITKTNMAKRMQTSRASLNRLLDENNPHLKLITLAKAATAINKKIRVELIAKSQRFY